VNKPVNFGDHRGFGGVRALWVDLHVEKKWLEIRGFLIGEDTESLAYVPSLCDI
jgi:hypothetical protein